MKLGAGRKAVSDEGPAPRPPAVSPDELVRLSEQRLALSLEVRPITTADVDLSRPLVPQIRDLLAERDS
jgi:hypothetical protein